MTITYSDYILQGNDVLDNIKTLEEIEQLALKCSWTGLAGMIEEVAGST